LRQGASALLRRLRLAVPAAALALGPSRTGPLPALRAESSARGPLVGLLAVLVLLAVAAAFAAARQRPRRGAAGPPMAPTRWLPPRAPDGRPDTPSTCDGCGTELAQGTRLCPSCGRAVG
jgi:hypothetical protein